MRVVNYKKLNLARARNTPVLVWLFLVATLVNIFSAPSTISSTSAIRQNASADIKSEMLKYEGTYITHNLYSAVDNIAPDIDIIISEERDLPIGSTIRSRLLAIADINSIRVVEFDDEEVLSGYNPDQSLTISGEVWDYPGYPRLGRPGYTWEVHYSDTPEALIFINKPDDPKLVFVDLKLLSQELQSKLKQAELKG